MILITGGLGFIGLHTAHNLLERGESVVLTRFRQDRQPGFIRDACNRAVIEDLDVTDGDAMLDAARRHAVDSIIHLATPARDALDVDAEARVRMGGLLNVLETARICQVRRLSIASSAAVYAGTEDGPFKEDMALRMKPGSAVEAYKKAWEVVATHYAQKAGLDIVLLRIASIWGPLAHWGSSSGSSGNVAGRLVHAAMKGREPELPPDVFEEDGQDYCYARDCARGIALVHTTSDLAHRTYNIGSGQPTTHRELAEAVRRHYPDAVLPMKPGISRPRRDPYMDISRVRSDTGYEPAWDLDEAMADYVAWLKENPE